MTLPNSRSAQSITPSTVPRGQRGRANATGMEIIPLGTGCLVIEDLGRFLKELYGYVCKKIYGSGRRQRAEREKERVDFHNRKRRKNENAKHKAKSHDQQEKAEDKRLLLYPSLQPRHSNCKKPGADKPASSPGDDPLLIVRRTNPTSLACKKP